MVSLTGTVQTRTTYRSTIFTLIASKAGKDENLGAEIMQAMADMALNTSIDRAMLGELKRKMVDKVSRQTNEYVCSALLFQWFGHFSGMASVADEIKTQDVTRDR